jgi:hypothetical protein
MNKLSHYSSEIPLMECWVRDYTTLENKSSATHGGKLVSLRMMVARCASHSSLT